MLPSVLFVDDDPAILESFKLCYRKVFQISVARNSHEALNILASGKLFEVIVTDIRMPGMSGLEFLRKAREISPNSARIVLTGYADTETALIAVNQGHVYKFLAKPCSQSNLSLALRDAVAHAADLRNMDEGSVRGLLAALHFRNLETKTHVERVGRVSALLAKEIGWSEEYAKTLHVAATMHDIGKIGIPDSVLLKPGALSLQEYEVMKNHTNIGAQVLASSSGQVLSMARDIALHHHERPDGLGYPNRLHGEAIPLCARVVAVADVYDALVSDRVYRSKAFTQEQAVEIIIKGRSTVFDAQTVDAFVKAMDKIHLLYEQAV